MQGCAAINTHGLPLITQLAGVAGGTTDVEVMLTAFIVGVSGEAHWQVTGVQRGGLLGRVNQKSESG